MLLFVVCSTKIFTLRCCMMFMLIYASLNVFISVIFVIFVIVVIVVCLSISFLINFLHKTVGYEYSTSYNVITMSLQWLFVWHIQRQRYCNNACGESVVIILYIGCVQCVYLRKTTSDLTFI